ncbi:MAG: transposase [Algoriphagus sp.]|nr:transposase [Algoriphagus sp.]
MHHSHSNIWTHLVLWTNGHQRQITSDMVPAIKDAIAVIQSEFPDQQIPHSILQDHIHLLIKIPGKMSVDQLVEHLQLEICKKLEKEGFNPCLEWDPTYHAHSVSLNRLSAEKSLLERQEYKHKEISLFEELKFLGM